MIKILLNPKKFKDYDAKTGESQLANQTLFIVGPSSVTIEKAMVPYNSGKWGKETREFSQSITVVVVPCRYGRP